MSARLHNGLSPLVLLLIISKAAFPDANDIPTVSPSQLQKDLFKKLSSDHYFKNATCREFANYNLMKNGLPKIGEAGPVHGTRLSTDRRNEESNPPNFEDSLVQSEKPYSKYKISASGTRTDWRLTIDRELEIQPTNDSRHLLTRTVYHFKILDFENKGSCAITGLDFQASHGNSLPVEKSMNLDSCMDLFLRETNHITNSEEPSLTEQKAIEILRGDCATSMRYSLDAKEILAKPR